MRVVLSVPTNPDTSIKRYRLRFTSTDALTLAAQIVVKASNTPPTTIPTSGGAGSSAQVTVIDDWFTSCDFPHFSMEVKFSNGDHVALDFTASSPSGTTYYDVTYGGASVLLKYPLTYGYSAGNGPGVIVGATSTDTAVNHCQD